MTAIPFPEDEDPDSIPNESSDSTAPQEGESLKPAPISNEDNLAERIMLNELTRHTNKSEEQLHLELERELAAAPPATRIDPANPPNEICWVEVPESVLDALNKFIAENDLPIDRLTADWLEAMVAEHNGIPAEMIAADDCIIRTGKSWRYLPESAKANTGFSFYPSEK